MNRQSRRADDMWSSSLKFGGATIFAPCERKKLRNGTECAPDLDRMYTETSVKSACVCVKIFGIS